MTKDEFRKNMADTFANILEEKGLSWRKEWSGIGGGAPHNAVTRACYRGLNAFWLSLIALSKGYSDPRWVTMVQIMDRDGKYHPKEKWHLKAGSKAAHVEYWYPFDLKNKKALTWEAYRNEMRQGRKDTEFRLATKYTLVFNASDIEGIPQIEIAKNTEITMDALVTRLSNNMSVPILLDGGDRAYYAPYHDKIHLPTPESFENAYAFNATALHELAHSTAHPSRLNRARDGVYGLEKYAYEELIAEMCSCFMGCGLAVKPTESHIENHKAYVQNWISAIREKPEALVYAIKEAQRAANYMDWKAGLMTDREYVESGRAVLEVSMDEKHPNSERKTSVPER